MKKKEIIEQYVRKFPDTPNLTLAKKIMKDKPELFTSVDNIRRTIRVLKGASGEKDMKYAIDDLKENRDDKKNPFKLPESDYKEWSMFYIPKSIKKLLILSDVHLPYHDLEALNTSIQKGVDEQVDGILLNGDLIDFHTLSRFIKDPSARSFWDEIELTREFLQTLRNIFPNAHIYYKIGNHEERWENYMRIKAPEILDCKDFKLDVILRLAELGIHYIDDKRIIDYIGLLILHGHEFFGAPSQAVNPARGLFLKSYTSSMMGHLHKTSEHTEYTLKGDIKTTWSLGCLCGLNPEYARINKWNHGFAIVDNESGIFRVKNYRIFKGKLL